jgi:hypothetical protein
MQYLVSVIHDSDDGSVRATDEEAAAIDAFNEKLRAEGAWVFAGGLHPIESATTVDYTGDEPVITDGPYVETKEFLAGFWILEAPDLDVALELATRGSKACHRKIEVRPFL